MKLAGLLTLFIAANSWLLADEAAQAPAPVPPASQPAVTQPAAPTPTAPKPGEAKPADAPSAKVSPELSQPVTAEQPKDAPAASASAQAVETDVLELPKVTVTHKQRPRLKLTEEVMMTPQGFNEKLAKESYSSLDRSVLNRFTLPSWTGAKTPEERAREEYRLKKNAETKADALNQAAVAEVLDPAQAKTIRDAVSKP
jgi:hypothetical protein